MSESTTDVSVAALLDALRRRVRMILFLGGVGALLYWVWDIARLFLFAALIAYLLDPLVRRFQETMGRTTATLLVLGLLGLGLIGVGVGISPVIEQQVQELRTSIQPERVEAMVEYLEAKLSGLSTRLGGNPVNLEQQLNRKVDSASTQLFHKIQGVLGIAVNVIAVPFLAVFLLRDGPRIKRGLIRLVPNRYFEFSLEALHKIDLRLGDYLRGIVTQSLLVGGLAIGVLWVLEVPSFLLLGVLIGVTNFIPYFGPLLGGGVVVLVELASSGSAQSAGLVLAALLALQLLDEAFITPVVFGRAVDLHPLEVLLALWIAAKFFGLVGLVLAIPVASAGKVVLTEGTALIQQYRFSPQSELSYAISDGSEPQVQGTDRKA